ncbi:MAG: hypothetical protein ACYSUD_17445 [Planctomycetota bacterium]|jgi:hypothetical protein
MKQPGKTSLFALVCVSVLLSAYGVGLGIKKVRFAGIEAQVSADIEPEKPAAESGEEAVAASKNAEPESPDGPEDEVAQEQEEEDPDPRLERREGRGMISEGMRVRSQNMSEEERLMAQMRARFGGRGRGEGGGGGRGGHGLSEEDRESYRAEMEELGARADEMSEEELSQARRKVMEKYGITPGQGGGGGAGGGRGGRR